MNRSLPLHVKGGNHYQGDLVDELKFPAFNYYLDESDPDVFVLRRQGGAFVAAFSASGITKERASSRPPRKTTAPSSGRTGTRKADSLSSFVAHGCWTGATRT